MTDPIYPAEFMEAMRRERDATENVVAAKAVILFADVIGSAVVADELSAEEYDQGFIQQFQSSAKAAAEMMPPARSLGFERVLEARGDEVMLVLLRSAQTGAQDMGSPDIKLGLAASEVFEFAFALKVTWLTSPYNLRRLKNGQLPRDCAVGMHSGEVTTGKRPLPEREAPEGHAISVCKRVEQAAHSGSATHVYATFAFEHALQIAAPKVAFVGAREVSLKGMSGDFWLSEPDLESLGFLGILSPAADRNVVPACGDEDILRVIKLRARENPREKWLVRIAAEIHFRCALSNVSFEKRVEMLQSAIEIWPKFSGAYSVLIATYEEAGMKEQAQQLRSRAKELGVPSKAFIGTEGFVEIKL